MWILCCMTHYIKQGNHWDKFCNVFNGGRDVDMQGLDGVCVIIKQIRTDVRRIGFHIKLFEGNYFICFYCFLLSVNNWNVLNRVINFHGVYGNCELKKSTLKMFCAQHWTWSAWVYHIEFELMYFMTSLSHAQLIR